MSGELPFESHTPIMASVNITDMSKTAPDVREKASADKRERISPAFAAVVAKGLEKNIQLRFKSADEMSTALHRCLVLQGEGVYSVYISYRESSANREDQIQAALLYDLLNNTTTKKGKRVFVCMKPISHDARDNIWEEFSLCLMNSLLVVPVLSISMLKPLESLKGSCEDQVDTYLQELILIHALSTIEKGSDSRCKIQKLLPVSINQISYTDTRDLVPRESASTIAAVQKFLRKEKFNHILGYLNKESLTVKGAVEALLSKYDAVTSGQKKVQNSLKPLPIGAEHKASDENMQEESEGDADVYDILKPFFSGQMDKRKAQEWRSKLKSLVAGIHDEIDTVSNEHKCLMISCT